MIKTGLVSVTFRDLTVEEITDIVVKAELDAIEWGGDIHVPHGDIEKACEVRKLCDIHNISTPSYGSYYRAGISEDEGLSFSSVLETAKILEVNTIRVWAGRGGSEDSACEVRKKVTDDLKRIASLAKKDNISISLEYHKGTLTDSDESTGQLIKELNDDNIFFYWQPPNGMGEEYCIKTLKTVIPSLSNIHVFHWEKDGTGKIIRLPLEKGIERWEKYLNLVAVNAEPQERYAMIEFVKDGTMSQLFNDAKDLRRLVKSSEVKIRS